MQSTPRIPKVANPTVGDSINVVGTVKVFFDQNEIAYMVGMPYSLYSIQIKLVPPPPI